jgi:hypothetical protein
MNTICTIELVGLAVMLKTRIQEVLGSKLGSFFSSSVPVANARVLPRLGQYRILTNPFSSLFMLSYHSIL